MELERVRANRVDDEGTARVVPIRYQDEEDTLRAPDGFWDNRGDNTVDQSVLDAISSVHVIQPGENPTTIAADVLGRTATQSEIDLYARAIVALNPRFDDTSIPEYYPLALPRRFGTMIVIGGGADMDMFPIAQDYVRDARNTQNPQFPFEVVFFGEHQTDLATRFANNSLRFGPLVLVGHSYGATTAALVATRVHGRVDLLVGVDPVEKAARNGVGILPAITRTPNIASVVTINGDAWSDSRGNLIESLGRAISAGPEIGPGSNGWNPGVTLVFRQAASSSNVVFNMPANHEEFRRMFQAPLPGGLSAEQMAANIIRSAPR